MAARRKEMLMSAAQKSAPNIKNPCYRHIAMWARGDYEDAAMCRFPPPEYYSEYPVGDMPTLSVCACGLCISKGEGCLQIPRRLLKHPGVTRLSTVLAKIYRTAQNDVNGLQYAIQELQDAAGGVMALMAKSVPNSYQALWCHAGSEEWKATHVKRDARVRKKGETTPRKNEKAVSVYHHEDQGAEFAENEDPDDIEVVRAALRAAETDLKEARAKNELLKGLLDRYQSYRDMVDESMNALIRLDGVEEALVETKGLYLVQDMRRAVPSDTVERTGYEEVPQASALRASMQEKYPELVPESDWDA